MACGSCTLCCDLMRVAMEPPKPERVVCSHCTTLGCSIYAARPKPCREFMCLWRASQDMPGHAMPADLRPDRTGVVAEVNNVGTVIAHCAQETSWAAEPIRGWLLRLTLRTTVMLETERGGALLSSNGTVTDLVRVGVDPETNNRLYVRADELERATSNDTPAGTSRRRADRRASARRDLQATETRLA